jgi:multiple sugar transport system ATP-binding protein
VIPDLDLDIEDGEFVVFVGPSGCGKSTLLRLIAGLEDVTSGRIEIDGRDMTRVGPAKRKLAMVFQSYALYPHMSVRKNIGFPLKMAGLERAAIDRKVEDAARILNLTAYLERRPGQLSGGQRQRVAIGRAIVREPSAFLFRRAAVEPRRGAPGQHAARDLGAAPEAQDHDGLRHPRPGRGDDHGRQDRGAERRAGRAGGHRRSSSTASPRTVFVAGFIGSPKMNLIDGQEAAARRGHDRRQAGAHPGEPRSRDLEGHGDGGRASRFGHVHPCRRAGPRGDQRPRPRRVRRRPGRPVWLTPEEGRIHRFDKGGQAL